MRFRPFSTVFTYAICIRVSVLIHFHERDAFHDAFSMKTISVLVLGGSAERIEMYAFSNGNALVWMRASIFHSRV